MPIFWYDITMVLRLESAVILGHFRYAIFILGFCMDSLNIFWFYKMCKGFIKAMKGKFHPATSDSEEKPKMT